MKKMKKPKVENLLSDSLFKNLAEISQQKSINVVKKGKSLSYIFNFVVILNSVSPYTWEGVGGASTSPSDLCPLLLRSRNTGERLRGDRPSSSM